MLRQWEAIELLDLQAQAIHEMLIKLEAGSREWVKVRPTAPPLTSQEKERSCPFERPNLS